MAGKPICDLQNYCSSSSIEVGFYFILRPVFRNQVSDMSDTWNRSTDKRTKQIHMEKRKQKTKIQAVKY